MSDLELANPIIFGPKFPSLKLRMEGGVQYLYSDSSYNLYTHNKGLLATDGTFQFGSLRRANDGAPFFAQDKGLWELFPRCVSFGVCDMLVERWERRGYKGGSADNEVLWTTSVELRPSPALAACPLVASLLDCCTTPAEKKFAETYYTWAVSGIRFSDDGFVAGFGDLQERCKSRLEEWHQQQLLGQVDPIANRPWWVANVIWDSLRAPALIPQVWLNYTYRPDRPPQEERLLLKDMPRRVDFLFIYKGRMHVVEIDDPSHYARYDEANRRYEVDEERYTRNLRADRTLRSEEIEIHRLSNWEILTATESELLQLIEDALGVSLWLGGPDFSK